MSASGPKYYVPKGGMPEPSEPLTGRAVFTPAYAFIPKGTMRDIVTSALPFWDKTRAWILARPLSGFSETFCQYIMEIAPGGGSTRPEPDINAEAALFVVDGTLKLSISETVHIMEPGGFAYIPPGTDWSVTNDGEHPACFHWFRKCYDRVEGLETPDVIITNEQDIAPAAMPDTKGCWSTTRFIDPDDMRYDMHINIVTFEPGGKIPFEETHVMEHGLYVLEGKADYLLNKDWVEVEAGDFMWLRAFCPQACKSGGPGRFRYLLYKDVNRHPKLSVAGAADFRQGGG